MKKAGHSAANLTSAQRASLEVSTRQQNESALWYEERRYRITGSKCGKNLNQKARNYSTSQILSLPKTLCVCAETDK